MDGCKQLIEEAWQNSQEMNPALIAAIHHALKALDVGELRVSELQEGEWVVNQWLKKAILLSFKLYGNDLLSVDGHTIGYDKIPLKCSDWSKDKFAAAGFRMVPGAVIRRSAYIGKNVILMPSFINIGAYVDEGTMIDTWATVGSCAQIGKNCHISGGVGIGGVLEPLQANPVIIEDDVFIGARSEVAEGVIVERGAVLSMGVFLGASTRIYDRETGETFYGRVPAHSVVVPGALPSNKGGINTYAAIIVKKVDAGTKSKTALNQILREAENA
jgi:2,3,4,5-tetrahydropyridine-2-carboxylate N-succinyltransferase